ncbi:hypothetical protein GOP47_0017119 [Adiantum capillus-veneris]|uniref:Uncharacterized protein n=1 Tax=Adiantum capillus-veneris TaxID=13818 RepID=A0A9D4UJQ3_ADICA|nr:hypothetical protein GOP47_0017119 [Adiantum capillus-veneris]
MPTSGFPHLPTGIGAWIISHFCCNGDAAIQRRSCAAPERAKRTPLDAERETTLWGGGGRRGIGNQEQETGSKAKASERWERRRLKPKKKNQGERLGRDRECRREKEGQATTERRLLDAAATARMERRGRIVSTSSSSGNGRLSITEAALAERRWKLMGNSSPLIGAADKLFRRCPWIMQGRCVLVNFEVSH